MIENSDGTPLFRQLAWVPKDSCTEVEGKAGEFTISTKTMILQGVRFPQLNSGRTPWLQIRTASPQSPKRSIPCIH